MKRKLWNFSIMSMLAVSIFCNGSISSFAAETSKRPFLGETSENEVKETDAKKGIITQDKGIITGEEAGMSNWRQDETGWKLQYADGSWAAACWELINGSWYYFREDGYAAFGWYFDSNYEGYFYIDVNAGMKTGWQRIDEKWYYFYEGVDGPMGKLAVNTFVHGYKIDENGIWTGEIV